MDFKHLYLSLAGRTNRLPYWIGSIILGGIQGIIYWVASMIMIPSFEGGEVDIEAIMGATMTLTYIMSGISIIFIYPSLALAVKRCHDRGRSGWFLLVGLIPIVNLWVVVELLFLSGTQGSNNYGPDPKGGAAAAPAKAEAPAEESSGE